MGLPPVPLSSLLSALYGPLSFLACKDEPLSLPHELSKTLLSVGLSSSSWASAPHPYLTPGSPKLIHMLYT